MRTKKFMISSLESLIEKYYKDMKPHNWKSLQVTLDTANLTPEDNVEMAQRSNIIVYSKYIQAASTIIEYKGFESAATKEPFFAS